MLSFLRFVWYSCLLCAALVSHAAPVLRLTQQTEAVKPVGTIDVLEDRSGRLTLADVASPAQAQRFTPYTRAGDPNFGYSTCAYWLRLTVAATPQTAGAWLLEVGFPPLKQVDTYDVMTGRHWAMGDHLPFALGHPVPHRSFVVPLELDAGTAHTLYLRIASTGTLTVPLTLWPSAAFLQHSQDSYFMLALYYGMLLALALYNLLLYLSLRDRAYLTYVAFTASMAVGMLSLNGFGNQYLWPDVPVLGHALFNSGFAATGLFGALFIRLFLDTRRQTPALDRLIVLLAGLFAVAALGPAFLPYRWCAMLTSLCGASFSLVAVLTGIQSLRRHQPGARYFLLAWTLLLAGVGIMALRNLAWLPTNALTANGMQVGSSLEMLLLSFALADRIQTARREKDKAQAEALLSKETMLATLRQHEQLLEQRVNERTRELARTNARLLASENKLSHMAHHDPLTGLANRLLLHERLNGALLRAQQGGHLVAVLVLDLDGFKPVNDNYGHETGDRLLAAVADRLRQVVRSSDTVARTGGDEFVAVLSPVESNAQLATLADRIAAAVKATNGQLALPVSVSASIGIALYPTHGNSIHSLLQQADQAMYVAKSRGRDCWHLLEAVDVCFTDRKTNVNSP